MSKVGYKCPKCGKDNLQVKKELWCLLSQSWILPGTIETLPWVEFSVETPFDGGSVQSADEMCCNSCGYNAKANQFEWSPTPAGTIQVMAEKDV